MISLAPQKQTALLIDVKHPAQITIKTLAKMSAVSHLLI